MKTAPIPQAVLGNYDGSSWSWHLKRNISRSPTQLALIFGALGLVSLIIGFAFYWVGASKLNSN
jgi:branched-subunit amino acid transport protein